MTRARTNADNVTADIAGITAGTGITGGGTSGTVTITNSMATAFDTKGDLIGGTGADTFSKLAVGANGTVLTAASGEATGLQWATVAAGSNWTLLNSGGTTLSGSSTVTVSGISNADKIAIFVNDARNSSNRIFMTMRFNSDTGSNYNYWGSKFTMPNSYDANVIRADDAGLVTSLPIATTSSNGSSRIYAGAIVTGANTANIKMVEMNGGVIPQIVDSTPAESFHYTGLYQGSSTISSVSFISSSGNFSHGTVFVYTSA